MLLQPARRGEVLGRFDQLSPELGVEAEVGAVRRPPHGLAAGQVPDQLEVGGGDEGGRGEGGEVVPAALGHLRPAISNSAVTTTLALNIPCVRVLKCVNIFNNTRQSTPLTVRRFSL